MINNEHKKVDTFKKDFKYKIQTILILTYIQIRITN